MMTAEDFRTANVLKAATTPLADALRDKLPLAYTLMEGTWYFAAKEKGDGSVFDPVWTLFGLGKVRKAKKFHILNYDKLSESEQGIIDVPGRFQGVEVCLPGSKDHVAAPTGAAVQVKINVQSQLAALFPVPATTDPLVSDIKSISASVKSDTGTYTNPGTRTIHRLYMATAFTILRKMKQDKRDAVVAIVVDKEGRIISWGRKNPDVPCWHGETSSIMRLGGKLPAGCCVFSTLKPCKMCSGLIFQASGGDVRVYWGEDDPTGSAAETVLDTKSVGFPLDGNKPGGLAPYPLLKPLRWSWEKDPDPTHPLQGPLDTMANSLKNSFKDSGERSTIDHVATSEEASYLIREAELSLKNKIAKYSSGAGKNENVKRVVEYLVNFLKLLKLNPDELGR